MFDFLVSDDRANQAEMDKQAAVEESKKRTLELEQSVKAAEEASKKRTLELEQSVKALEIMLQELQASSVREAEVARRRLEEQAGAVVTDPVELAKKVGVSPNSIKKIESNCIGELRSFKEQDCTSPAAGERNYYQERVARCLTPSLQKICQMPKFKHGEDVSGVARLLLKKVTAAKGTNNSAGDNSVKGTPRWRRKRRHKYKASRKLNFDGHRHFLGKELDGVLRELGESWRSTFRAGERDAAARILQMTLTSIPQRRGRVSDWLGPMYFDEVLSVERNSNIRLLNKSDKANFRNRYTNTSLGTCHRTGLGLGYG